MTQNPETPLPRVVLLHGFLQSPGHMEPIRRALETSFRTSSPPLPGHGLPPADPLDPASFAEAILREGPCALVGYSMGARVALLAASMHPEKVWALVLISATAGVEDPLERNERQARDLALASSLEKMGPGEFDGFLLSFVSQGLFAGRYDPRQELARRRHDPKSIAWALRVYGQGSFEPLWATLPSIAPPTLVAAADDDPPYREAACQIYRSIPRAWLLRFVTGGHALVSSQPPLASCVAAFLRVHAPK